MVQGMEKERETSRLDISTVVTTCATLRSFVAITHPSLLFRLTLSLWYVLAVVCGGRVELFAGRYN
jgi:hypothetical protein